VECLLNVCVRHGELIYVVYGACHLMLIVPSYHYCAVICHYNEFMKPLLTFAQKCINCDNELVNFVATGKVCCMVRSHDVSTRLQCISVLL